MKCSSTYLNAYTNKARWRFAILFGYIISAVYMLGLIIYAYFNSQREKNKADDKQTKQDLELVGFFDALFNPYYFCGIFVAFSIGLTIGYFVSGTKMDCIALATEVNNTKIVKEAVKECKQNTLCKSSISQESVSTSDASVAAIAPVPVEPLPTILENVSNYSQGSTLKSYWGEDLQSLINK